MFAVEDSGPDWIFANHLNQERTGNRANGPPLVGIELSIPIQRNDSDYDDDDDDDDDDGDYNDSFQNDYDDDNNNNNYNENSRDNRRDTKKKSTNGDNDPNNGGGGTTSKSTRKSRSVLRQVSSGQRFAQRGSVINRSDSKKRIHHQQDNNQEQQEQPLQQQHQSSSQQHQQKQQQTPQRSERRTRTSDPISKSSNHSHTRNKTPSLGNNNSDHYHPHTKLPTSSSNEPRTRRQSLHMTNSHTSSTNTNTNYTVNTHSYHGPNSGSVRRNRTSNEKDYLTSTTNHSNGSGTGGTNSFFKLLDIDPTKQRYKLDEEKFMDYITNDPSLCSTKHSYTVCNGDSILPLHMICALGATLNTVKYCFKLYPDAIQQPSMPRMLSCLHYAVLFTRAPLDVIMFLVKKEPDAIHSVTRKKQTPLHLACLCPPTLKVYNPEVAQLLTEIGQQALCLQLDKHGRTPLHIACGLETPCLEVVEDLTEVNNTACLAQCYDYQSTPLHIACSNRYVGDDTHVIVDAIKDLVRSCPDCVRIVDKDGQLPIYVAVTNRACLKVCKMLVRKYPECLEFTFNHPISPNNKKVNLHELAKILQLEKPIIDFLNPYED